MHKFYKEHHHLAAKSANIEFEEWDFLIDSYLEGALAEDYLPDLQECKDRTIDIPYQAQYTGNFFQNKDPDNQVGVYSSLYNITAMIGDYSDILHSCYATEQDVQDGFVGTYLPKFGSFGMYSLTWISNLLGKSLVITDRINDIVEAEEICDLTSIAYYYGRLTYYSWQVDPLPEKSWTGAMNEMSSEEAPLSVEEHDEEIKLKAARHR